MDIIVFNPRELPDVLGALLALVPHPTERHYEFLTCLARLHGSTLDVRGLRPLPTWRTAATLVDPHQRERLVQLGILYSVIDAPVTRDTARAVAELASALDIVERGIATLYKLANGHPLLVRAHLGRRIMGRFVAQMYRENGWRGVKNFVDGMTGRGGNAAVAARYAELQSYPSGSLGRELWEHCHARGFALPGTKGAIPERLLFHDVGHMLSGYDTDPAGEIQQAAFQAGFLRNDGFAFAFFGVLQFHHGIRLTPVARAETGFYDVTKVLTALARGAACNQDLSDGWDFWSHAATQLDELRDSLGVERLETVRSLRSLNMAPLALPA